MDILNKNWRISHLYKIVNKEGQRVTFKPNTLQKIVNNDPAKRKIALKSRQIGFSTNEIIKQFDHTIFNRNITSVILAHEHDAIEKLFRIARRAYEFLPEQIKPKLDRGGGSKYEMYFPEINSRIYCDLESRGDTIQWLHVSEAAFMKDSSRLKSTLQAVPLSGIATIESTPNGMGNYFYEVWNDQDQVYKNFFFPWYMFDDYKLPVDKPLIYTEDELNLIQKAKSIYNIDITQQQIQFRRFKKQELKSYSDETLVSFEQEYPEDDISCFLSSGNPVVDLIKVKETLDNSLDPIFDKDNLKIYESFDKNHNYIIACDVAEGKNKDYSVAVVLDATSKKIVAVLRCHSKPYDFALRVNDLAKKFSIASKMPLLAVERNNHGHAVILELNEHLFYPNLYVHTDGHLGWRTDSITRPLMIDGFIKTIENQFIKIEDKNILNETLTLINNNGKIEASTGKHDDCVIACSIAIQLLLKNGNLNIYDNLDRKILI